GLEKIAEVIAETGIWTGRRKRCVDSTVFDDAAATQDPVTQLVAAIRRVVRTVPGADRVVGAVCTLDYAKPGKPDIDWDDPAAKQELISTLVNDALAVLAELCGPGAPERDGAAAEALGLLALVAGQDVEPAEGNDGTDGRWRIAKRVAPDRVISTVDTQARHTRKSRSQRRDGYRGHLASEPETGLITDCEMTMATSEANTDAAVAVKMACRDRFHHTEGTTSAAAEAHPTTEDPTGGTDSSTEDPTGTTETPPDTAAQDTAAEGTDGEGGLEVYGDSAYGSGQARAAYADAGHDVVIKPKPVGSAVPGGFTVDDFTVDENDATVT